MEPQQTLGMSVTTCAFCQTQLSYPSNSLYIQCPKCQQTMNPRALQVHYITCLHCGTLLSHPPQSLAIQCPKCEIVMSLTDRADPGHVPPPTMGMPSNGMAPPLKTLSSSAGSAPSGASSRKAHKKRKDPHAPKRASNAYMIFCKERRQRLKLEHPDLPFGRIGAQLGEMWRNFSPEEKKPYEDRAVQDRERYKREMELYVPSMDDPRDKPKLNFLNKKPSPKEPKDSEWTSLRPSASGLGSMVRPQYVPPPQMQQPPGSMHPLPMHSQLQSQQPSMHSSPSPPASMPSSEMYLGNEPSPHPPDPQMQTPQQ